MPMVDIQRNTDVNKGKQTSTVCVYNNIIYNKK